MSIKKKEGNFDTLFTSELLECSTEPSGFEVSSSESVTTPSFPSASSRLPLALKSDVDYTTQNSEKNRQFCKKVQAICISETKLIKTGKQSDSKHKRQWY